MFQSTHPRGVRPLNTAAFTRLRVSIHAPTRGATENHVHQMEQKKFQSTHPRGVRLLLMLLMIIVFVFQSTHPRGVRRQLTMKDVENYEFQSTHPRGVRLHILQNTEY